MARSSTPYTAAILGWLRRKRTIQSRTFGRSAEKRPPGSCFMCLRSSPKMHRIGFSSTAHQILRAGRTGRCALTGRPHIGTRTTLLTRLEMASSACGAPITRSTSAWPCSACEKGQSAYHSSSFARTAACCRIFSNRRASYPGAIRSRMRICTSASV
jgi:hypothetical protein